MHTLRHHLGNDEQWFGLLKSFYKTFEISHIETDDFIKFAEEYTGKSLEPVIRHYLYKSSLPVLAYSVDQKGKKKIMRYRWEGVEPDFNLSIWIKIDGKPYRINPSTEVQERIFESRKGEVLELDLGKSLILEGEL